MERLMPQAVQLLLERRLGPVSSCDLRLELVDPRLKPLALHLPLPLACCQALGCFHGG